MMTWSSPFDEYNIVKGEEKRYVQRGYDGENQYLGWLEFQGSNTDAPTEVTVHLSATPPPQAKQEMSKVSGDPDTTINEGLEKSLQSIKNLLEGQGGKVEY